MSENSIIDSNAAARKAASTIISRAIKLGASLAGICSVRELKKAPSFKFALQIPGPDVGGATGSLGLKTGEVYWPEAAESMIVIAYAHPGKRPGLDWWIDDLNPAGNRVLIRINRELSKWVESEYGYKSYPLHYYIEKGGTFLKDAAVMAGLGCIGKNNLLITPQFGPRVRLRAVLLSARLPAAKPIDYFPCAQCAEPCLNVCPEKAFNKTIYNSGIYGLEKLPGRDGSYDRSRCNLRMQKNIEEAAEEPRKAGKMKPVRIIKYCRKCELICPAGRM